MSNLRPYSDAEIKESLQSLNLWEIKNKKLYKNFKFKNFNQALRFMVGVGVESEKMDHHPEWFNVYGNVRVELMTHKVNGITNLDFELAKEMDKIESEISN